MSRSSKDPVIRIKHQREVQEKTYAYHAHDYREVLTVLGSGEGGLSHRAVLQRRTEHGENRLVARTHTTWFDRLVEQLASPLSIVLIITFFVTLGLAEFVDAGVIFIALLLAVLVGIFQEGKASQAFEKLAASQARVATVIRDGKKQQVDAVMLVPGDIVVLQNGNFVPADLRLTYAKQLQVNEATLTGEWAAVNKSVTAVLAGASLPERHSMAWMGTFVTSGYGRGVVVATGQETEVGKLARSLDTVEDEATPLQVEMAKISRLMLFIISGITAVIFVAGVLEAHSIHDMLLMAIAVAVASIPEGLPAAVTIVLAVSMESLLRRGGLVRNLLAAETLGATTYVLTDKTGTLTEARMAVVGFITGGGDFVARTAFADTAMLRDIFDASLAATDAYTDAGVSGQHYVRGESAEVAILEAARLVGIDEYEGSLRTKRIDYVPFASRNRYAAGLVEDGDNFRLCVNGAPHTILSHATKQLTKDGLQPLKETDRQVLVEAIDDFTHDGKRLIAVAEKAVRYDDMPETEPDFLDGLVFLGILVIDDPLRDNIAVAIEGVQSAGARLILVTGDNPETAHTVAVAVGITDPDGIVLTGSDLEALTDQELLIALRDCSVFARILPQQKLRIASVLQQQGEVVAMTGDGVNDAPALRRAHIGVSLGSGTEVAKEASDLVLVNDSFDTIYAAIEEGRRIISNIRKIVGYLLATSLTEVVLILMALVMGTAIPLLPAQILWANIIEEGFMGVAFAFERSEPGAMRRRPHDAREEGILSAEMLWFIVFVVTMVSMITGALYFALVTMGLPLETVRSVMFVAISIDSLFIAVSFRSLNVPLWRIPLYTNRFFAGSFLMSLVMLLAALNIPFLMSVLSYQPLSLDLFALPVAASLAALITVELGKAFFFERK